MVNRKDEILSSTYTLFSEKGYYFSMADVAEKSGIKPPSIYSHFSSKDDLVFLTITKEVDRYHEILNAKMETLDDLSADIALKNVYYTIMDYFLNYEKLRFWKNISMITNIELREQCSLHIINHEKIFTGKMINVIESGMNKKQIQIESVTGTIFLYVAMIQGIMDGMLLYWDSGYDLNILISKSWEAFWFGIKVR